MKVTRSHTTSSVSLTTHHATLLSLSVVGLRFAPRDEANELHVFVFVPGLRDCTRMPYMDSKTQYHSVCTGFEFLKVYDTQVL